jgi:hypothetical protein
VEIKEISNFSASINKIIEKNKDCKFLVNNGEDYLNWRYCDYRAGEHKIFLAVENGNPLGYIIIRINRYIEEYPIAYIMDLLTIPEKVSIADPLLKSSLKHLDSQDINLVTCMVPKGHPYERIYNSHGFIDSRINLHLFTNLNEKNKEHLLEGIKPSEAHFCHGSIDSLPISLPRA